MKKWATASLALLLLALSSQARADLTPTPNVTPNRQITENVNMTGSLLRVVKNTGQIVTGSTFPVSYAQFTASGTVVFQSTGAVALAVLNPNGQEVFRISSVGYVGIGLNNPVVPLQVVGSAIFSGTVTASNFIGDGSGISGIGGVGGNNVWSATQTFTSAVIFTTRTCTASCTITVANYFIDCDASSGNVTLTLPPLTGTAGRQFHVAKIDATNNSCIVAGAGSDTINGQSNDTWTQRYTSHSYWGGGSEWRIY